MSEDFEYMDESLQLQESNDLVKKEENAEESQFKRHIKQDFEYARNNIKSIIDTGMVAISNLSDLAEQTQNARIYECLANVLQINSLNNSMLLDIDAKFKDLIDGKVEKEGDTITNNTLFIATTTDIQRMIEEKIKGSK